MIQISTFPAAPSTERVPSLAERVASLRYSINLQLLNNRVPGLLMTNEKQISVFCLPAANKNPKKDTSLLGGNQLMKIKEAKKTYCAKSTNILN